MSKTIKYTGLNEAVYENIKKMILEGDLLPGAKLQEELLCDKLGTSKTPIKLALAKLEQEGLVTNLPRKGSHVTELEKEKVLEIYQVRAALEGLVCSLAAQKINDKDIDVLEQLLQRMASESQSGNNKKFLVSDEKFHAKLLEVAGLRLLTDHLNMLYAMIRLTKFRSVIVQERISRAYQEHCHILEALREKNDVESEYAMKQHILNARNDLLKAMQLG